MKEIDFLLLQDFLINTIDQMIQMLTHIFFPFPGGKKKLQDFTPWNFSLLLVPILPKQKVATNEGQGASCNTGFFRVFFLLLMELGRCGFLSEVGILCGRLFLLNTGLGIEFWTSKMEFRNIFF